MNHRRPLIFIPFNHLFRICEKRFKIHHTFDLPIGKIAISTKINNKSHIIHGEIIKTTWPTIDGDMHEFILEV